MRKSKSVRRRSSRRSSRRRSSRRSSVSGGIKHRLYRRIKRTRINPLTGKKFILGRDHNGNWTMEPLPTRTSKKKKHTQHHY